MFLLRKADQCQRLKALARRDRDRDHGADRPGPAWGPVMGLQMRTRGNSHAGCRRQRWVAIFNLSTLHRVGLQIVRGSVDIWMDMYCSKWEAGRRRFVQERISRSKDVWEGYTEEWLAPSVLLRVSISVSNLSPTNPPRDALHRDSSSISEAAVQTLEAALASLTAQPTTAHGGDATSSQSAMAACRPTRIDPHQVYRQPWLFSSFGGGGACW